MCNLAAYTGKKAAAPILIEMLRREEYIDGGLSTGIATIHEGKLYYAKVVGDVNKLLEETDALNFPGTCGIAHSRPANGGVSQAHPFVDKDENLALILNGTARDINTEEFYARSRELMQSFLDRGYPIRSAVKGGQFKELSNGMGYHDTEFYALSIGEYLEGKSDIETGMVKGMANALDTLPADITALAIHKDLDGVITAGRITRPMFVTVKEGEAYMATTPLAYPDEVKNQNIIELPLTSVSQISPSGVNITDEKFENVRVEDITFSVAKKAYDRMEAYLLNRKDSPRDLGAFGIYECWRDMWHEPFVDCKYAKEGGLLKPYAAVLYNTLWAFYKEGRLHTVIDESNNKKVMKFWIE